MIDRLWPGLTARDDDAGVRPLLQACWTTKSGQVIASMPAKDWRPDRFATTDIDQLPALFAARGCRLRTALAHRIVALASGTLPPHPTATAGAAAHAEDDDERPDPRTSITARPRHTLPPWRLTTTHG